MKVSLFVFLCMCPIFALAQANMYDRAVPIPIIDTYVPMSHEYMVLKAAAMALERKQNEENFERYSNIAYDCLKKNQIANFIGYAQAALNTNYYNSLLYYNLGVAYCLLKEKRKGKKFLKKALKNDFPEANRALYAIKQNVALSNSWFIY